MTYQIEKDDDSGEFLLINSFVDNDAVKLEWPQGKDDRNALVLRSLEIMKSIANANDSSFAAKKAFFVLQLLKVAKEAALQMYDDVFPDVAQHAQAFVEEMVDEVKRVAACDPMQLARAGAGENVASDQYLTYLLNEFKTELGKTGAVSQRVGWLVAGGMALLPITPPPERHRYFKAIAEVAQKVNAEAVVLVTDAYQLSPDGERTGDEILSVMWIHPDSTCMTTAVGYTRRKHPNLGKDIIAFSPDIPTHASTQSLIPAWGI
jgi:hypothetical protein